MPRKLTACAKAKRVKKAGRKIEDTKGLPSTSKRSMIEGLYRIGWDALKIIKETDIPQKVVYQNIKHFEERRTCRPPKDASIKLKAIAWAHKYGSSSAAKNFKMD